MRLGAFREPASGTIGARMGAWVDGQGSLRHLEALRIAAGPLVLVHLLPFLADAASGVIYLDRFHEPYAAWYPQAPRVVYLLLLWLAVPAALALSAGFLTRWAAAYTALFVGYNLFLSRTHFGHNRAFLLVLVVGLAFLPLGRAASADALIRARSGRRPLDEVGPLWPVFLMRIEVVAVYFGSGFSKLVDPDWFGGTVTRLRVVQWRDSIAARGVPDWALDLVASDGFHLVFAKLVILTELAIAVGLVLRRGRPGAMWLAVWFHVAIELTASVQVFSYAGIAALVIWVTPFGRERVVSVDVRSPMGRSIRRAVVWLDWTRRFRVEGMPGSPSGAELSVTGVDGARHRGPAALLIVATRLPALFPFVAPFNLRPLRALWWRFIGRVVTRAYSTSG